MGQNVQHFEITSTILDQIAGKVFVTVKYENGEQDNICLKGSFNPGMMALDGYSDILEALYERKVNFVNDIAPKLSMELSYFRWAGTNPEKRQTIVIMDDLTKKGYKFETAFKEWPINRVKAGVEQLAALHAG